MLVDIDNKEILVGDEVYMPEGDRNYKIKIVRIRPASVAYYVLPTSDNPQYNTLYYFRMSSVKSRYLVKI